MARETIADYSGHIKGYIETTGTSPNRKSTATSFTGLVLGYWDEKEDLTRDYSRKIIARGNVLSALIMNNRK